MSRIKIDSTLRINPTTTIPSDCQILCNEVLDGHYQLKGISLPVTYWNVNSTNSIIYWTDTGGARSCIITNGFYSSTSALASVVASTMTAAGSGTVTCSTNSLNQCLTISNTVPFAMGFGTRTTNSASILLGFIGNSSSAATSQTGTQLVDLATTTAFHFQISNCSTGIRTTDGKNFTFILPAYSTTPSLIYFEPSQQFPIRFRVDPTNTITIRILDDQFRVLNHMYSNWYMVWEKVANA